ncbi:interactor of constitutive active ROPs 3-like isoform X2 [Silene latifolia]|uniref:interactor of constitutive active ROPs 3-like isoform X2 n=1 Tax=Silene latifolia TaxID=37657 RepID=UPI003D784D5F
MQSSTKGRASPKESPKKVSVRPARQLNIIPAERNSSSPSSNATVRTPKDTSSKVIERRSPRSSPICEKKRPSKLSELESQVSKLENDLKTVKDQLIASESQKKEAQADAEDVKKQLSDVSVKLEESEKQLSDLCASKNATATDLQDNPQEDQEWESKIEALTKQQLDDAASLASVLDEIQRLKEQLNKATESEENSSLVELQSLKNTLAETRSLADTMKHELVQAKESEAQAQNSIKQTLAQLEAAKDTINALRSDIANSTKAYDAVVSELQQSRAHVSFLESFAENLKTVNSDQCQMDLEAAKLEVRQLRSALEAAETRAEEERSLSEAQIRSASEISAQIKDQFSLREADLKEELRKAAANIEELKGSLMDKETELQGISEENDILNSKLMKSELEPSKDQELGVELMKIKANLTDKENELQNVLEKNETLKLEITKLDASRAAEMDALAKVARVAEQLERAQATNGEMEAELRRLKVQSDQWRKAAEAAASMLSPGSNGKYVDPTGPLPLSPYLDDYDEDSFKKKNGNGNVLKKIGVLWKKPQK